MSKVKAESDLQITSYNDGMVWIKPLDMFRFNLEQAHDSTPLCLLRQINFSHRLFAHSCVNYTCGEKSVQDDSMLKLLFIYLFQETVILC